MNRPRVLDLYSKAGGAAMGYHRAGFDVVGVDKDRQPRYPFRFCQADIIEVGLAVLLKELGPFDAVHASPPCQAFTAAQPIKGREHPDLVTPTRQMLERCGLPWIIENVEGAPLRPDLLLCGSHFGLQTKRHRLFELSFPAPLLQPVCAHVWEAGVPIGVYGHTGHGSARYGTRKSGNHGWFKADWERAMGIDWMSRDELAEAIPPAYTEYVGRWLLEYLALATVSA